MNKLHLRFFLFFSLASVCNTAISNDTIAHQRLYFNTTQQQSSTPTHTKTAECARNELHNHNKKHNQYAESPTQSQLKTVLTWMSQLYPSASAYVATQPTPSIPPQPSPKNIQPQLYDSHEYIVEQRNNAREHIKKNNCSKALQHYMLSNAINDYCTAHDIAGEKLKLCNGDALQQIIHEEFIAITTISADLWKSTQYTPKTLQQFPSILADFTNAGVTFNHADDVDKAITLADTCWMILDCIQAIGEGVIKGVSATVDEIVHPIRTVQNIIESTAICGYYLGKMAIEVCELEYLTFTHQPDEAFKKRNTWACNVITVYEALQEKCTTLTTRDAIKETVAFGTQCYATTKALRGLGTLFKHARNEAIKIIEKASHTANAPALTTPEGIVFRIADNTVECMKNAQPLATHIFPKASNMAEFFDLPFGKILAKNSQKIPERFQHSPIYKIIRDIPGTDLKKGHFYYLDRFHKDHMEVFDRAYQCINVYNLDGTPNPIKYNLARKDGRNIRNLMKGKQ